MSLIRKHVAVLQAWACLALVVHWEVHLRTKRCTNDTRNVYKIISHQWCEINCFAPRAETVICSCSTTFWGVRIRALYNKIW